MVCGEGSMSGREFSLFLWLSRALYSHRSPHLVFSNFLKHFNWVLTGLYGVQRFLQVRKWVCLFSLDIELVACPVILLLWWVKKMSDFAHPPPFILFVCLIFFTFLWNRQSPEVPVIYLRVWFWCGTFVDQNTISVCPFSFYPPPCSVCLLFNLFVLQTTATKKRVCAICLV